jgi:hypothetical protein
MSNYLAIATVTATLVNLVQAAMLQDGPGMVPDVEITTRPPKAEDRPLKPRITVFLYQVTFNAALRNADLPTRSPDGRASRHPQAALDLDYLISFYGNEGELEAQRMLGKVVSVLHSQPILTSHQIQDAINTAHRREYLSTSNLADQVEQIKFTPQTLDLEELSKLWSMLFQAPYALSVLYRASTVLIESDEELVTPAPAVERPVVDVSVKSGRPSRRRQPGT